MLKPTQEKFYQPDNDDLLEGIEGAMNGIAGAMESLRGIEGFSYWFDVLGDLFDEMEPDHERYEAIAQAEYAKEIAGLTRDYYRSVL